MMGELDEVKSESSEIEEELQPEEDFRNCGERIQQCLFDGAEIPDQLYVDLFVAKLRMTYEYKDKATLKARLQEEAQTELDLTRSLPLLEEELRLVESGELKKGGKKKKRTAEVIRAEIQEVQARLNSIQTIENNGWVLVDFPANFSQAKLLEKALSGYQLSEEMEPT
jgi:hypothetical protein